MNIHDLSEYQLYKLKSIDPTLSSDWSDVVNSILPKLNQQGQDTVYENILKPRGIFLNDEDNLIHKSPNTLRQTVEHLHTNNQELSAISRHMLKIIDPNINAYNAIKLADEVEAILSYLDSVDTNNSISDQKYRQMIRTAFLYDLAIWIESITLEIKPGLRRLDTDTIKSYFKEVFIKQQIQGRDFRNWDSSDLSFQELTHLPSFIKKEGKDRKFFIVEGQSYWFLIGSANKVDKNAYSFRRFLYEDESGNNVKKYIYLTHIVLKKDQMHDPQYMEHAAYCMTRLYTLDVGVSDTLLRSVHEIQQLYQNYLQPLLRAPLEQDGSNPEIVIRERLIKFEKQLSILILQKLPGMIEVALHDVNDQDYLFYHLDQLIKKMNENIEDFRLQPFSMYSTSNEIMAVKLTSMAQLLNKSRSLLCSQEKAIGDHTETMKATLEIIKANLEETEDSIENLKSFKDSIDDYKYIKENGSFWQKLKSRTAPEYSLEDISQMEQSLQEDFFMSTVRLAKIQNESMIYVEFECNSIINEQYRHYAIADGKLGISRLPRILRLNEDKSKFNIQSIRDVIYQDIFKSNQQWNPHNA